MTSVPMTFAPTTFFRLHKQNDTRMSGEVGSVFFFCLFKRVPDQGPEQRESNLTVLCLLIIIILISYNIIL
jgi:hypothetical protein